MGVKDFSKPPNGTRFGRLVVTDCWLKDFGTYRKKVCSVICDCGTSKIVSLNGLRRKSTRSCGCFQKEKASEAKKTHGESKSDLHRKWWKMKTRCSNPNTKDWKNYGGRGIKVCKLWDASYEAFRDWCLANGYSKELELDRIKVNGNYSPSNCRFVTKLENANNTRATTYLTYKGETKSVPDWARSLNVNPGTLHNRRRLGWSDSEIIETPILSRK